MFPCWRNTLMSVGRASFWLSRRVPSASWTHSEESPMGPSVGLVSAWIMTLTPPGSSTISSDTVLMNLWKPRARSSDSSSAVGYSGSRTVVSLLMCSVRFSSSKWSRCRCETYR
jgi:hypothetical protein